MVTKADTASRSQGWTKVRCACCVSERIEPLVLVKLGEKVGPETKRWLIRLIGAPQKDGGKIFDLLIQLRKLRQLPAPLSSLRCCSAGSPWRGRHRRHHRGLGPALYLTEGHRRLGTV